MKEVKVIYEIEDSVIISEDIMDAPIAIVALGKEFNRSPIRDFNERGLWFLSFVDKGSDIQVNYTTVDSGFNKGFGIYNGHGKPLYEGLDIDKAIETIQNQIIPRPKDRQVVVYYKEDGLRLISTYILSEDLFKSSGDNWDFRSHIDKWEPVFDENGNEVFNTSSVL